MALQTYNFQNQQVTADPTTSNNVNTGQGVTNVGTVAPITSSTANTSGSLSNVQTGAATVITPESLQSPPPIVLPQADNNTTGANSMVAELQTSIDNYNKLQTPTDAAYNAEKTQADSLTSRINDLIGLDANKGTDQVAQEQAAGIPDLKKQIADINGQVTTQIANYNAAFNALENNPQQTAAVVGSKQQQLQRTQAADISLLQARGLALQGNLSAAQDTVNRAIDLKYSSYENELTARQNQLNTVYDQLSKAEQKQANSLQLAITDQQTKLADLKAKQKTNVNTALVAGIATKFVNQNGEFYRTSDGTPFATPQEFFKAAGVTSFDQAYQQGLVTDLSNARLNDINTVQQIIAKYPDAGIKANDSLDVAKQKLKSSPSYRKDTYMAPVGGANNDLNTILKTLQIQQLSNQLQGTDTQRTAAGYADRLVQSNQVINTLQPVIQNYNTAGFYAQIGLPSFAQSSNIQQYNQAVQNFVNSVLRRESGAAISQSEYTNATKQYFPLPGDSQATLDQKAQNRTTQINNLIRDAGPAASTLLAGPTQKSNQITQPDGTVWQQNSDGSYTRVK